MGLSLVGAPIGANVDTLYKATVGGVTQYAPAQLGTVVNGTDGTQYVLVQAAATSAAMASTKAPNAYAIASDFTAKLMTTAQALAGLGLGFAPPVKVAAGDWFWARTSGTGFNARVAASAGASTYLRTTTTAGRLGTASTASSIPFQAVITVAASASTSAGNTVRNVLMSRLAPIGVQASPI